MATGSEGSESASMMARMEDVAPPSNVELEDPAKLMTLTLWIALTKAQFDDLVNGKPVIPDEYSNCFGLRCAMLKAVERANLFMSWSPEGSSQEPRRGIWKWFQRCLQSSRILNGVLSRN